MALAEHLEVVDRETAAAERTAKEAQPFHDSRAHWISLRAKLPWIPAAKLWAEAFREYLAVVRVIEAVAHPKPSNLICDLTLKPFSRLKAVAVERAQSANYAPTTRVAGEIVRIAIEEPKTLKKKLSQLLKCKEIESYRDALDSLLIAACNEPPSKAVASPSIPQRKIPVPKVATASEIILNEHDRKILDFLSVAPTASYYQANIAESQDLGAHTVRKSLKKLLGAGYVHYPDGERSGCCITKPGLEAISSIGRAD